MAVAERSHDKAWAGAGRSAASLAEWRARHTPGIRTGAIASGAASLLWLPQAALIAFVVGRMAGGQDLSPLIFAAPAYFLLGVLRASLEAWGARSQFAAARACVSRLRANAALALAARSPLDGGRLPSGQAASVVAEQAEAVLPWLLRFQPARWRAMVLPLVIALCVASLSWIAALVLLLTAPAIPLFMIIIGWRAKAASAAQLQQAGGMNGFLLDRLRGLGTLRALGAVDLTARRLRQAAEAVRSSTMAVLRIAFLSSTALELFAAIGVALVAVYVGFHLLGEIAVGSWGRRLSLAQGMFILLLAPAFYEPLRDIAALWHDKAAGEAACAALAALDHDSVPLPGAAGDAATSPATGALAVDIDGLCFQHGDAALVFDGLQLHIEAGEHVAVVGASGSGKTTLLSLIAGLAAPTGGAVRIAGVTIDESSAAGLRARMAWIGQAPHVFAGTVGGNVAMGRPQVTHGAVDAAIAFVGLNRVHHASAGDRLGEGGAGLSGGELVRLSLARAAAAADSGLLLADEPTAHLDRASAAAVADAMLALARGRTLVVATHDLALAARIGRVIDLDALTRQRRAA